MSTCESEFEVRGMRYGEQITIVFRVIALCISVSVFYPWLDKQRRQHMRMFFLHWTSGVVYVLSRTIMLVMVLNCWVSKAAAGPVIYLLKFFELTAVNLWGISSLAIALLIANIVKSFSQYQRVPSVIGSPRTMWCCVAAAVLFSCLSMPFWNDVLVTGAYFVVVNTKNDNHLRWVRLSFVAVQAAAGVLMAVTLLFTVTGKRRASLKVCCKTSGRVTMYFILTILGTCVYLYNGAVHLTLFSKFTDHTVRESQLIVVAQCAKYVHVIADTFVLFSAFRAIDKLKSSGGRSSSGGSQQPTGSSADSHMTGYGEGGGGLSSSRGGGHVVFAPPLVHATLAPPAAPTAPAYSSATASNSATVDARRKGFGMA